MKKLSSLLMVYLIALVSFGYYPDEPEKIIQGKWMRRVEVQVVGNLFRYDTLYYEIGSKSQDEIVRPARFIRNFISFIEYNEEGFSKESFLYTGDVPHIMSITEWDDDMEIMSLKYLKVTDKIEDSMSVSIVSPDSLILDYDGKSFGVRRY